MTKDPLEKVLRDGYGNDEMTNVVLRAAVNPAMTTVATWAAELVQTSNVDFLDRLIPNFIYPQLKAMGVSYTFGNNGVLKIPVRAATPTLAGAWTAEGGAKPVKRASFSTVSLTPTKLSVISTFSEEMATYGMPSIEGIIRQAMSDDTGIALDSFLIDNVAASAGVRPAGLLNGVTPITASAATPALAAMVADLKALVAAITAAGGGGRGPIAILLNPAQALALNFVQTTTGDFAFSSVEQAASKFGVRFIVSATRAGRPGDRSRCGRLCHRARRRAALCGVDRGNAARGRHDAARARDRYAGFRRACGADAIVVPDRRRGDTHVAYTSRGSCGRSFSMVQTIA